MLVDGVLPRCCNAIFGPGGNSHCSSSALRMFAASQARTQQSSAADRARAFKSQRSRICETFGDGRLEAGMERASHLRAAVGSRLSER